MIPLWCKGKDGSWHRFPYEALTTLKDGRLGMGCYRIPGIPEVFLDLYKATGWGMEHWFDYSPDMDAYVLREVDSNDRMSDEDLPIPEQTPASEQLTISNDKMLNFYWLS